MEFHIKDFLIQQEPDKIDSIKKATLQNLIQNKVPDANIKICAERAAWLGNDETHYERKWDNAGIDELYTLIELCTRWIESYLDTQEFLKKLPTNK